MEENIENSMTQKLEVVTRNMENTVTPVARKPEAVMPKVEGNDNVVARKPETVSAKAEGTEAPPIRKPEVVTPKTEGNESPVAPKPEAKPEVVTPKAEGGEPSVAPKPEVVIPKGESIGYPMARKPEAAMPKTEGTNNSQVRRPEAPMPRPEAPTPRPETVDYSQARRPEANMPRVERDLVIPESPVPSLPGTPVRVSYKRVSPTYTSFIPQHDAAKVQLIKEQCRSFCLSLFFRERDSVHSLGITSSIPGEGKTFIASMMAHVLSIDSSRPVLLVECDWENANNHDYFGIPPVPGLAEWLRGECAEADIRHQVSDNLTVIRAGDGQQDAVRLIQYILQRGLQNTLARNDENLLIDLPPVITSSYSVYAANMVDALALVVRAGVTPDNLVADACNYLSNLPVQGIILNQVDYRPRPYSAARKTR